MYHCRPNATVKAYPDSPIMLARHDSIVSEEGDYSYHPKPYGIHGEGAFSYSLPHPGPLAFAESDDGTVSAYPGGVANDHYSWPSTEIHPRRSFVSPTPSGGSWSSTDSTGWSNDRNFVASSPAMGFSPSPLPYHQSVYVAYACGGHSNEPCFDPREAQYYPDPEPVQLNYEDEMSVHAAYAITHQHPFQVMVESAEDLSPHTHGYCYEETLNATSEHSQVKLEQIDHGNEQFRNSGTPKTKRPRRQSRQSLSNISIISTTRTNVRVTKRLSPRASPNNPTNTSHRNTKTHGPRRSSQVSQPSSAYPCPLAIYGCSSTFGTKNEWKRHVNTQHLRLDLWRCDLCPSKDGRPNEFNRKDLFVQHLRRMHFKHATTTTTTTAAASSSKKCSGGAATARSKQHPHHKASEGEKLDPLLATAEERCRVPLRRPPSRSACFFCPREFVGQGSWDERMEHVGRHLEAGKKDRKEKEEGAVAVAVAGPEEWNVDRGFEQWLLRERLIVAVDGEWRIGDGRKEMGEVDGSEEDAEADADAEEA